MKKSEVQIGQMYSFGGDVVTVICSDGEGLIVECPMNGQDFALARNLKSEIPHEAYSVEPVFYD